MKQIISQFFKFGFNRIPYVKGLRLKVKEQGKYPAGHYYSPIPASYDVLERLDTQRGKQLEPRGIELNQECQLGLLNEYSSFYEELPFPVQPDMNFRYYYQNVFFSYGDAIFLYSFLRKQPPRRIIEIGSGFSSAVMLDTIDKYIPDRPDLTFVEPFPQRLESLLKPSDKDDVRVIQKPIQQVPLDLFSSLQSGDLLFIDSTHVLKFGSDLQVILFDILPSLPQGVYVHFHDIFYPFEYPSGWLKDGIYWNEIYMLRAFLANNSAWRIYFFNDYVAKEFGDEIGDTMPLCLKNPGGGLYIQKVGQR